MHVYANCLKHACMQVNKTLCLVMAREVKGGHIAKGFDRTLIPKMRELTKQKKVCSLFLLCMCIRAYLLMYVYGIYVCMYMYLCKAT